MPFSSSSSSFTCFCITKYHRLSVSNTPVIFMCEFPVPSPQRSPDLAETVDRFSSQYWSMFLKFILLYFYFIFRKYPRHKGACSWNKCKCFWGERVRQKEKRWQECKLEFTGKFSGSRVAEWLERWTCHSEVPSSSQGPWLLSEFVLGSSEFKSSVTFVKIQPTGLTPTSYDS